jgi:phospholipid transport system substrate-binding protein
MPSRRSAAFALAGLLAVSSPILGAFVLPGAAFAQAQRDPAAEAFVSSEVSRALSILNGSAGEARKAEFRAFVDQVADVPRITHFVLGKYNRTITPAQFNDFAQAFRLYANSVYEDRLGQYHGEKMQVVSSVVRQPGDVIVTTQVVGGQTKQPIKVLWRVLRGSDGRYRAVDVSVEGIWLAITEQQDFVSTLDNNHGDIPALIAQLRSQTK